MPDQRIRDGWEDAGRTGSRVGPDYEGWTPVHWNDEGGPDA